MRKTIDTRVVTPEMEKVFKSHFLSAGSTLSEALRAAIEEMPPADVINLGDPYEVLRAYVINNKGLSKVTQEHKAFLYNLEEVLNEVSFYRKIFSPTLLAPSDSVYPVAGRRTVQPVPSDGRGEPQTIRDTEPDFG